MSGQTGTRAEGGVIPAQPEALPALAGVSSSQRLPINPNGRTARDSAGVDANLRRQ